MRVNPFLIRPLTLLQAKRAAAATKIPRPEQWPATLRKYYVYSEATAQVSAALNDLGGPSYVLA